MRPLGHMFKQRQRTDVGAGPPLMYPPPLPSLPGHSYDQMR